LTNIRTSIRRAASNSRPTSPDSLRHRPAHHPLSGRHWRQNWTYPTPSSNTTPIGGLSLMSFGDQPRLPTKKDGVTLFPPSRPAHGLNCSLLFTPLRPKCPTLPSLVPRTRT
jgi:hypothetical protein